MPTIIIRPPGFNTTTHEPINGGLGGNTSSPSLSSTCCSRIFSALEAYGRSCHSQSTKLERQVEFDEYATRFTYSPAVDETQSLPDTPATWLTSSEQVIDEFQPKVDGDPKKIEGKWVLSSSDELSPLAACYAMLMMDADELIKLPPSKVLSDTTKSLDSNEISAKDIRSAVSLLKLAGVKLTNTNRSVLSNEELIKRLLTKKSKDSWSAVIITLQTPSGAHPVIADEYDPSMGTLFIRDPSKGKSFSMHIDDFLTYNPSKRFLIARKGLSNDEVIAYNSTITDREKAGEEHRSRAAEALLQELSLMKV